MGRAVREGGRLRRVGCRQLPEGYGDQLRRGPPVAGFGEGEVWLESEEVIKTVRERLCKDLCYISVVCYVNVGKHCQRASSHSIHITQSCPSYMKAREKRKVAQARMNTVNRDYKVVFADFDNPRVIKLGTIHNSTCLTYYFSKFGVNVKVPGAP